MIFNSPDYLDKVSVASCLLSVVENGIKSISKYIKDLNWQILGQPRYGLLCKLQHTTHNQQLTR